MRKAISPVASEVAVDFVFEKGPAVADLHPFDRAAVLVEHLVVTVQVAALHYGRRRRGVGRIERPERERALALDLGGGGSRGLTG